MSEWSANPERLRLVLGAIAPSAPLAGREEALAAAVAAELERGDTAHLWLALAVLRAELPTPDVVVAYQRMIAEEGSVRAVGRMLATAHRVGLLRRVPRVTVVAGATVVDAHHTARTRLATGIQRVVRKTAQVWNDQHPITFLGWDPTFRSLRELTADEKENALHGTQAHSRGEHRRDVLVPWNCTYVLPELAVEPERTARIAALAEYSGNRSVVIGYDCVPFTTAETTAPGMASAFARNLTALSRFDRIAAISGAAAGEYSGWRHMLSSIGLAGPEVREIFLAAEPELVDEETMAAAARTLIVDELPMVLCVGSHEPRKNHLAVLQASERLWLAGRRFSLTFVGGNSWGSGEFERRLAALQEAGWPVQTISAISDDLLWSAYQLATCTVFPSLNEGFGLPVAESLSAGTPVVTSRFGSMAEIAEGGGAILVDPRDDDDVLRGIESALFDSATASRLRREAAQRIPRSWVDYAQELWSYAHADELPGSGS